MWSPLRLGSAACALFGVVLGGGASAQVSIPSCSLNLNIPNPTQTVFGVDLEQAAGDELPLRFSWTLQNDAQGAVQSSYVVNITAADTGELVWTSGETASSDPVAIVDVSNSSLNLNLSTATRYQWAVVATMLPQNEATVACTGSFETAPARSVFPGSAKWIGGGGLLRRSFDIGPDASQVASARAYVTGLGSFYLLFNGNRDPVGENVMDPIQTVYSKRVVYETFDVADSLQGGVNEVGLLLGNYKLGYNNMWCDMIAAGGPNGCRAAMINVVVIFKNGTRLHVDSSNPADWTAEPGPVAWDHFFHGETFNATQWTSDGLASAAVAMSPPAASPPGMAVRGPDGHNVTFGPVSPNQAPPLRIRKTVRALSVSSVSAADFGGASVFVFDFGQNAAGMTRLSLPAGHNIPAGTALEIAHAEIVAGPFVDNGGMCELCPGCQGCQSNMCIVHGSGAVCDTYCRNPAWSGGVDDHALRNEPCFPHQTYGTGQYVGDRYIGDFNNANMTNVYIVQASKDSSGNVVAEHYTPFFAAAGFRYAQLRGLPANHNLSPSQLNDAVVQLQINSLVESASSLTLPVVSSSNVHDILNRIHNMTRETQLSNLWTIPTDCPQRERRGWMGDAQASSDEAMLNFHMGSFYESFLRSIRDDQIRYNENNPSDTGALADVVPFDGIGGNPGCPVWQVAYVVIARNMWKHYGSAVLPILQLHYGGLRHLMDWFERHADPTDHLLVRGCYGDWMGFNPSSGNHGSSPVTPAGSATAFYHVLARKYMATIAEALGNTDEAEYWAKLHSEGVQAYHARYFNATVGGYSPCVDGATACFGTSSRGSQTSNAMALALGAPPSAEIAATVAENLAADVQIFGNKTTVGVVGMGWLFPQLDTAAGRGDLALAVLRGDQFPSIGFMAAQNYSTLCENLACTAHNAGGGSGNHIMLGAFDAWMVASLGGLDSVVNGTTGGWRHIVARVTPAAITELGEAQVRHQTVRGEAALAWSFNTTTAKLNIDLTVPPGSVADVQLPTQLTKFGKLLTVEETRGKLLWQRSDLQETQSLALGKPALVHHVSLAIGGGRYLLEGTFSY